MSVGYLHHLRRSTDMVHRLDRAAVEQLRERKCDLEQDILSNSLFEESSLEYRIAHALRVPGPEWRESEFSMVSGFTHSMLSDDLNGLLRNLQRRYDCERQAAHRLHGEQTDAGADVDVTALLATEGTTPEARAMLRRMRKNRLLAQDLASCHEDSDRTAPRLQYDTRDSGEPEEPPPPGPPFAQETSQRMQHMRDIYQRQTEIHDLDVIIAGIEARRTHAETPSESGERLLANLQWRYDRNIRKAYTSHQEYRMLHCPADCRPLAAGPGIDVLALLTAEGTTLAAENYLFRAQNNRILARELADELDSGDPVDVAAWQNEIQEVDASFADRRVAPHTPP